MEAEVHRSERNAGDQDETIALIRSSASAFAAEHADLTRMRNLRGTLPGYDGAIWSTIAELGLLSVFVPERFGGLGLGCSEAVPGMETLASVLLPEPVSPAIFAANVVLHGSNDQLKGQLLPSFVSGGLVPAIAWQEGGDSTGADPIATTCTADGRLTGEKRMVLGATSANGYVVCANSPEGLALYWIPASAPDLTAEFTEMADGRHTATLRLKGVEVRAEQKIASGAAAEKALQRAYDEALIMCSAELVGVTDRLLQITLDYLKTRVQFGKPIGSFQSLKHRAADLYIQLRLSRHALEAAARRFDDNADLSPQERGAIASRVKSRCGTAAVATAKEAIQMHGAMGFVDECDVGLFVKRALVLSAWLGNPAEHRKRYARLRASNGEGRRS